MTTIQEQTPPTRTFYRLIASDRPTAIDFTSNAALGRSLRRPDPAVQRLWDGLSVFDSEMGARAHAARHPQLGRFIVELVVPLAGTFRVERTTRTPGHYTLWGAPETLLACVRSVVPV